MHIMALLLDIKRKLSKADYYILDKIKSGNNLKLLKMYLKARKQRVCTNIPKFHL